MSESKHTAGPWVLMPEFHGDHGQYYITDDADGSEVASVTAWIGEHRAEAEANARLIATAPDLLDALKWALAALGPNEDYRASYELAVSAIAKAEGSTP